MAGPIATAVIACSRRSGDDTDYWMLELPWNSRVQAAHFTNSLTPADRDFSRARSYRWLRHRADRSIAHAAIEVAP